MNHSVPKLDQLAASHTTRRLTLAKSTRVCDMQMQCQFITTP